MFLKKNNKKGKSISFLTLLLTTMFLSFFIGSIVVNTDTLGGDIIEDTIEEIQIEEDPQMSTFYSKFEWWNDSWSFRMQVNLTVDLYAESNYPVELLVNFTKVFIEGDVDSSELNNLSIRVVEYNSISDYQVIESQFDEWPNFDNRTNAIGDVIWIMNGTTTPGTTRNYFIYFENGTKPEIQDPGYDTIRLWNEDFEQDDFTFYSYNYSTTTQDQTPDKWERSISMAKRGNSSLNLYGNCWKYQPLPFQIPVSSYPDLLLTTSIYYSDVASQSAVRELTGIAIETNPCPPSSYPPNPPYQLQGWDPWSSAIQTYRNKYAGWQWNRFTLNIGQDATISNIGALVYIADDDTLNERDIFYDDASIWIKPVSTVPNNSISISEGEMEPISYSLKITCVDIDGRRIENANIYISNDSISWMNQEDTTESNGEVLFVNCTRNGIYNITVNFTSQGLASDVTKTVGFEQDFVIDELHTEKIIVLELWTIDFNITDIDDNYIEYGFVLLELNDQVVGNATLANGQAQIIWSNRSSYNYTIKYDYDTIPEDATYWTQQLKIYNGSVSRINPNKPTYERSVIDITDPGIIITPAGNDRIVEYEWMPDNFGRFYNYNLSFINFTDYIENYNLLDENDTVVDSFFDSGDYYINYSSQLNYTSLGKIHASVRKYNGVASPTNGTFDLIYVKSTKINVQVNMSTIHFHVVDTENKKVEGILEIYNATSTNSIVNITLDNNGDGRLIHFIYGDQYNPGNYSIKVYYAAAYQPLNQTWLNFSKITDPDPNWCQADTGYNFTLVSETWNTTVCQTNTDNFPTKIEKLYQNWTNIYWRDHGFVRVNFSAVGASIDPTSVQYAIVNNDFSEITPYYSLQKESVGIYNFTFDTSGLSGGLGQSYSVKVIGGKDGWNPPDDLLISFTLLNVLTTLNVLNYSTDVAFAPAEIEMYWGETLNLTVKYSEITSGSLISGATITFKWTYDIGGASVNPDPIKPNLYTVLFNSSEADTIGKYLLEFTAQKGNFSAGTKNFFINIINRPTKIDNKTTKISGQQQIHRISKNIYVEDAHNFTFLYQDSLTGANLTDLSSQYYVWEKYNGTGGGVIDSGAGFLNLSISGDNKYILDFDTETRAVGTYLLFVTLDKDNHDPSTIVVSLNIANRTIDRDLLGIEGIQYSAIQGAIINIRLQLTDPTRGGIPLLGATVNITIGGVEYEMKDPDGDGIYEYNFSTSVINAFIMAQILEGFITIEITNYESYSMPISIVVGMPEIFPGMPLFYFILIFGIIIVGVGGIAGYVLVQRARIPAFVKKTTSMTKAIKGNKSIPSSIKAKTPEEHMVDTLKANWMKLGLNIEETMGISKKKEIGTIKKSSKPTDLSEDKKGGIDK